MRPAAKDESRVQRTMAFAVRSTRTGSRPFVDELRRAVSRVNPDLPLTNLTTLQAIYDHSLTRTSLTFLLLAAISGIALFLGVVGIYAVVAYAVSQQTREIGIRLALGASPQNVTGLFVRHGLLLATIGGVCGVAAALAAARLMRPLLFDVAPTDPLTYVAAAALLGTAATLASYLPARIASRIDPLKSLRVE
jgi:ABC-type antimicrobial peptide transport system permease subunit